MKYFGAFLFVIGILGLGGSLYVRQMAPTLRIEVRELLIQAQEAGLEEDKWESVLIRSKEVIPPLPGLFGIRNAFVQAHEIVRTWQELKTEFSVINTENETVSFETISAVFHHLKSIESDLKKIEKTVQKLPAWAMTEDLEQKKEKALARLDFVREAFTLFLPLQSVFTEWAEDEERFIILFQNPNEPRSTGGFMGSLLVVDFTDREVTWEFQDIYAIDRKIPQDQLVLTPDWFQGLSKYLSLRDANFWPDFPTSAESIRSFFSLAEEKVPNTVVAITPEWVKEWLELIDGTRISKWDVNFTPENFDLVLQFLVESKIEGRWGVKNPVLRLAEAMFAPYALNRITPEKVANMDWSRLMREKHLLAHSLNPKLQSLFDRIGISGRMVIDTDADNFLAFDFISIGANKSEKFLWTRCEHNSRIDPDGNVENTLKIVRTHALRSNEIAEQLGVEEWSENVRDLLTSEIYWKLGEGENRTMLRVWVPADAEFISGSSPSGTVRSVPRQEQDFTIIEIPMNVLPGESLTAEVKYKTHIVRGSHNWRPYNLQIYGTPARKQTRIIPTISVKGKGNFVAETSTVGASIPLRDEHVHVVVEW